MSTVKYTHRKTVITPNYLENPTGSALIEVGKTKVICTVMVEESVPPWMASDETNTRGWITARYGMLPASGNSRIRRERNGAKGRTQEIERLIGRSLRAAVDLDKLGPRTLWVDCDVIQADGGTRTASITGAYVALRLAVRRMLDSGVLKEDPGVRTVAATSVGIVHGEKKLDLCYEEDSAADVDMNVVMDSDGNLIEVQATGENSVFTRTDLNELLDMAYHGIMELIEIQNNALKD